MWWPPPWRTATNPFRSRIGKARSPKGREACPTATSTCVTKISPYTLLGVEGTVDMARHLGAVLYLSVFGVVLNAQGPAKVDFQRDVQPILKANCIGCH